MTWRVRMKESDSEWFLTLEEWITIGIAAIFNLFTILFLRMGQACAIFSLNMIIMMVIFLTAYVHDKYRPAWLRVVRDWYVIPFLIVIYLENGPLVPLVNPRGMDSLVMAADRYLFMGNDPTVLMERIIHPAFSELMQIFYASFYFLPFSLCAILYFSRGTRKDFHIAASTILMGFYLSYLGYYLTPVLGPRFTMEHLHSVPLTGLWAFDFLRNLLAQAEGKMYDCMPSGHALVSLLTVLLSWRYAKRFFPAALVWTTFLLFSTVYLRYHYVTDLLVGMALGTAVFRFGPVLAEAFMENRGEDVRSSRADDLGRNGLDSPL
jgi:membrane-associated phospholipid phosphatase